MSEHFYSAPDGKVFRCGDGPYLEVSRSRFRDDGSMVIALDSNDAPELSLRLRPAQVAALAAFLAGGASE